MKHRHKENINLYLQSHPSLVSGDFKIEKKKDVRKEERTLSRFQFSWISSLELDYKEMKVKLLKIKSHRVHFSYLAISWEIVNFTTELRHAQIAKEY